MKSSSGVVIALLIPSLLLNVLAIAFVIILTQTSWLDVPLAAYSHQKNCVNDFHDVLKMADRVPPEQRDSVKQAYAAIVCQKDYKTGQPITAQSFDGLLKQLNRQTQ